MYGQVWFSSAMYGYVTLRMGMYGYAWLCIYVMLCRAICGYEELFKITLNNALRYLSTARKIYSETSQ